VNSTTPTPEFASQLGYRGYLLNIHVTSGAINMVSYYNADDFWLVTGHIFCRTRLNKLLPPE
jgi:hypothetical protein